MTSFNLSALPGLSFDPATPFLKNYSDKLLQGGLLDGQPDLISSAQKSSTAPATSLLPPPPSSVTPPIGQDNSQSISRNEPTPPVAAPATNPPSSPSTTSGNPASGFGISDALWNGMTPDQRTSAIGSIINTTIQQNTSNKSNQDNLNAYDQIFDKIYKNQREINAENQANQMAAFYATRDQRSFEKMLQALAGRGTYQANTVSFNPQVTPGVVYRLGSSVGAGSAIS